MDQFGCFDAADRRQRGEFLAAGRRNAVDATTERAAGTYRPRCRRAVPARGDYREALPIIHFDLVLEIMPPPGGEIIYGRIRQLIYNLRDVIGLPIKWVSFDLAGLSPHLADLVSPRNFTAPSIHCW